MILVISSYEINPFLFENSLIGSSSDQKETRSFSATLGRFVTSIDTKSMLTLPSKSTSFVHLTLVPYINASGELKTKPTQHSVKELRSLGIGPNCLICRSETELPKDEKKKIALFCSVDMSNVISMHDVDTVYSIPLLLHKQKVDEIVLKDLGLKTKKPNLNDWKKVVQAKLNPKKSVEVAMVGKYTELKDSYKSLNEATKVLSKLYLHHA